MAVLLGVYYLFLEKEKMHRFNRSYLLGALAFSLVVPFITVPIYVEVEAQALPQYIPVDALQPLPAPAPEVNYWLYAAVISYAIVTLLLANRFARNILKFYSLKRQSTVAEYNGATLVLLDDDVLPHTFLNNIYLSKKEYEHRLIEPELLTHELAHVRQKHTLDILFIELLKTVFWFNPLPYLYKRAMQMNHEFLADESTIENHHLNIPTYQQMLLDKATPYTAYALASSINFSITKKRFIMMTKTTSTRKRTLLQAMTLPVLALTCLSLCYEVVAQTEPQRSYLGKGSTTYSARNVTKQELDSLKKAEPKKYNSNNPEDYVRMTTSYTNDKGIKITEKSFVESKIAKDFAYYDYKWPDADKIKSMRIYKYSEAQNDSLKKLRPELYNYTDTELSRIHLTYENDKGKVVQEDLFIDNTNPDGSPRVEVIKDKPVINKPRPMVEYLPDGDTKASSNMEEVVIAGRSKNKTQKNIPAAKTITSSGQHIVNAADTNPQPEFPGGIGEFYRIFGKEFKFPDIKKDVATRAYVSFIIEMDGSMSNIKILKDPGYGMGAEVERVLKGITERWKPGMVKGKPVRTSYSLPISLNIKS